MRKLIFFGLSLVGLFDALYLLWTYVSPSRPMVCIGGGCDAVRASSYAYPWGVPMPVLGVIGYLLITLLVIADPLVSFGVARLARHALAAGTTFGFLFSAYLDYLQGFVIHAYCTWCVTSGVIMTILCALALYDVRSPGPEGNAPVKLAQVRSYFVVGVAALLLGVPSFYGLARHGGAPPAPKAPTQALAARLVRPDSHMTGNLSAAVSVVEFGDFQCPMCGPEEKVMHDIRGRYTNQVRFVFRQFPLIHIHPFAWSAAQASECAAEQGKFWEAVDEIYSRQTDLSEEGLHHDAAEIGLDRARFDHCMHSEAAAVRVRQDLEDGKALGVNATPTFFIGHQALAGAPNVEEFSRIINQELAAQGITLSTTSLAPPAVSAPGPIKEPTQHATASRNTPPAKTTTENTPSAFGLFGSIPGGVLSSFTAGAATCSEAEAAEQQPTLIDTTQLRQLLAGGIKPLFVDVRPPEEYAKTRIPGAVNIPAGEMPQRWNTLPKNRVIVFYESGRTSGDVCAFGRAAGRILLKHGYPFSQVKVYQDGLAGWEKSGLETAH